jgi:hypothetical protein
MRNKISYFLWRLYLSLSFILFYDETLWRRAIWFDSAWDLCGLTLDLYEPICLTTFFTHSPFITKINNISVDCFGVIRNALFISISYTHFKQRTQEIWREMTTLRFNRFHDYENSIVIFWVLMFIQHDCSKRWYPPTRIHGVRTQKNTIISGQYFGLWSCVITLLILMGGYSVLKESVASIFRIYAVKRETHNTESLNSIIRGRKIVISNAEGWNEGPARSNWPACLSSKETKLLTTSALSVHFWREQEQKNRLVQFACLKIMTYLKYKLIFNYLLTYFYCIVFYCVLTW